MSRAFVNEDATPEPEPHFVLPGRDSPYYEEAAARALLEGANAGDTWGAEKATGCAWGAPALVPHVRTVLAEAAERGDVRMARLARRFLRAAESHPES